MYPIIDVPHRAFLAASALLFALSSAVTVLWCASMSAMGGMPMPGGMSMVWMRMPGQTWLGVAASFLGMWLVMMVAMMLPCLVPMLLRYRRALASSGTPNLGPLTAIAGAGYFFVWAVLGAALFPLGAGLAAIEMQQPALAHAVPITAGVVVLIAGALQFSPWKTHYLARCSEPHGCSGAPAAGAGGAWRRGVRLGLHCAGCCANLMAILLVIGIMDLPVMVLVTGALTTERLARPGEGARRAVGLAVIGIGSFLIARAIEAGL
ncbi:MAG: DUF2182 domain-containing protein [Gammaproteobacteria bacterium]|nr:DUF2182 domain-containing protein [Gammaproteobacteria bacterium]